MLRVMYVEASMGGVVGGSLTGILHLLRGLDGRRFSGLLALYQPKSDLEKSELAGIPVRVLEGMHPNRSGRVARRVLNLASSVLPNVARLMRAIAAEKPDIVHACNGFRTNFDVELACRLSGVPCVTHVKGFTWLRPEEKFLANRVAAAIWMTDAIRDYYHAQGVAPAFARTIYDGLDTRHFAPTRAASSVRRELGVPLGAPLLAVAGNIQSWKGQKVVVDAMALLSEKLPELRCLMVGGVHRSGVEYYKELRRSVAGYGLEERVIFTGFRQDVANLLCAADIVVHSSVRPEPFGRVIIEGMSLGKPVIATAAGGVLEIITPELDGLLVPPADAAVLARNVERLLSDPALMGRLGARARRTVSERFSVERFVSEMEDFYRQLLGSSRSSATDAGGVPLEGTQ